MGGAEGRVRILSVEDGVSGQGTHGGEGERQRDAVVPAHPLGNNPTPSTILLAFTHII